MVWSVAAAQRICKKDLSRMNTYGQRRPLGPDPFSINGSREREMGDFEKRERRKEEHVQRILLLLPAGILKGI